MSTAARDGTEALVERVQELQARLDTLDDPRAQALADELVSAIVQMYGAGLERILATLHDAGEPGRHLAARLADDPLTSTLLLIHDLHPVGLEQRVLSALESVRPYMESHGGGVELLSLQDGVARIHLRGSCSDCSASTVTLELAIKQALEEAAPDLAGLEVEGVAPQMTGLALPMAQAPAATGAELPIVMSGNGGPAAAQPAPAWLDLDGFADPPEGTLSPVTLGGQPLVIANVEGTLLAYRDSCAACGGPLRDGELTAGSLACPACGRSYFLPRAGRSLDAERIQLDPVPLLREQDRVRVALPV